MFEVLGKRRRREKQLLDVAHYKLPKAPSARASATTRIDLTGKRFGRLVVTDYAGRHKVVMSFFNCDAHAVVKGVYLREGYAKYCGCLKKELTKARFTKHGMSGTPEYRPWAAMMERCFTVNPRHPKYENYGGWGITVYEDCILS